MRDRTGGPAPEVDTPLKLTVVVRGNGSQLGVVLRRLALRRRAATEVVSVPSTLDDRGLEISPDSETALSCSDAGEVDWREMLECLSAPSLRCRLGGSAS
mmetsp:Transcript_10563/g.26609  ORF Transcript_10563/g.26609 Transcript_10563/m.26609 type:complete len:100 (+) Transcript_10563:1816-2115(+)